MAPRRRGLRQSSYARVLAVVLAAGVATLGAATGVAVLLVRNDMEAALVDLSLQRATAIRDAFDARVDLARAELRGVALAAESGSLHNVSALVSQPLIAVRCVRNHDELLSAAADSEAARVLASATNTHPDRPVVLLDAQRAVVAIRAGGIDGYALIDLAGTLRPPPGWTVDLRPERAPRAGAAVGSAALLAAGGADVISRRRRSDVGDEVFESDAPSRYGPVVVVSAPAGPARAAAREVTTRMARWSLVAIAPLVLIAWVFSRVVTSPIRALAAAVRRSDGTAIALPALPNDEVGDLGEAIGEMSVRLAADARALRAEVDFAQAAALLREPDEVTDALLAAVRDASPSGRWDLVPAADVASGNVADALKPELISLRGALEIAAHETSTRNTEGPKRGVDSVRPMPKQRPIVPLAFAGKSYGLLVGVPDGADSATLRHVRLLAQSAVAALRNLELVRAAETSEKLVLLGRLSAGVAHEMRNPLAFILANLEALERDLRGEAQQAIVETRLGAERLVRIVQDLSSLSRGGRALMLEDADLGEIVLAMVAVAQTRRTHVTVRTDIEGTVYACCDCGRVEQMVLNLLVNAMDATRRRDAPSVTVRVRGDHQMTTVDVSDNGPGIPKDATRSLFGAFATTKGDEGTGLGLYLSRSYARAQNGDVVLVKTGPDGTHFQLRLPAGAPPAKSSEAASIDAPAASVPKASVTLTTSSNALTRAAQIAAHADGSMPRVLIIDDEIAIVNAMKRLLARRADVTGSHDAREALELTARTEFALILCDLNMPRMNGREFVDAIRARDPVQAARVVIVTGSTDSVVEGVRVINKPITAAALQGLIDGL